MAEPTLHPELKHDLYAKLEERGLLYQTTSPELAQWLNAKPRRIYVGFDPSSDCLHVGSLLPLMILRMIQEAGHTPIVLIGGATGMIGDPSGKSAERTLLSEEAIRANERGIEQVIRRFVRFDGPGSAILVNNLDWFGGMGYLSFLRDVGKSLSVNTMIKKDSVKSRLDRDDTGLSYTEFSYMLLQAYDFFHLYKEYDCAMQLGGSDQWGNMTAGTELIRKSLSTEDPNDKGPEVFAATIPLVTKSDGKKFGKSETGTLWLDADKTSPYQLYQYFLRLHDAEVIPLLKMLTILSLETIAELEKQLKTEPEKRAAQNALADAITSYVHGPSELERAKKTSKALFSGDLKSLDGRSLREVFAEAPSSTLTKPQWPRTEDGEAAASQSDDGGALSIVDLLVETGLCPSKGAARRDIKGGGVYLNNERIQDGDAFLQPGDLIDGRFVVLRKGKKNYHLVVFL